MLSYVRGKCCSNRVTISFRVPKEEGGGESEEVFGLLDQIHGALQWIYFVVLNLPSLSSGYSPRRSRLP